jgi:outer membrane protein assembly factor BamB
MCRTFRGEMQRNGYFGNWIGPRSAKLLWQKTISPVSGFGYSQPIVGQGGWIYLKDLADVVYCLDPKGNIRWQVKLANGNGGYGGFPPSDSSVTLHQETTLSGNMVLKKEYLFVTTGDAKLWKLRQDGSIVWSVQLPYDTASCSPAIWPGDGRVYVTSYQTTSPFDGALSVFSQNGQLIWQRLTPGRPAINNSPALDSAGNVIVHGFQYVTKYSRDGQSVLFDFVAGFHNYDSSALDAQENVYFGSGDGRVYALDSAGQLRWSRRIGSFVTSTPAAAPGGKVIVGSWSGSVNALDQSGNILWSYQTGSSVEASAIVDAQGYCYLNSSDGYLYCFSPTGQVVWQYYVGDLTVASVSPGPGGTLYAISAEGDAFCFGQ